MADRPTSGYPEWANNLVGETVDLNGVPTLIDNKIEPTQEWKDSGELDEENLPRQYINYQFDYINDWVRNLDERAGGTIGDVYTSTVNYATATLDTRFGGTWTAQGSGALGTIGTAYFYERTA
jgi:hypothetical protein